MRRTKKSKLPLPHLLILVELCFCILTCRSPACFHRKETLAERMAKRAKVSTSEPVVIIEDVPVATTGDASEIIPPGSESSPRRSPQRSPRRKYSDCFPLAGAGEHVFIANISGRVGEEQQVEPSESAPDVPPPSATPPRRESPARVPTGEPSHEEEPASTEAPSTEAPSTGTGGPTPTNVDGGGEPTALELNTGKLSCHRILLLSSLFCLLELLLEALFDLFLGL
jgi:hypothetical protein